MLIFKYVYNKTIAAHLIRCSGTPVVDHYRAVVPKQCSGGTWMFCKSDWGVPPLKSSNGYIFQFAEKVHLMDTIFSILRRSCTPLSVWKRLFKRVLTRTTNTDTMTMTASRKAVIVNLSGCSAEEVLVLRKLTILGSSAVKEEPKFLF
jgi:hypothetical protein